MSIADLLQESIGDRSPRVIGRRIARVVATARPDERFRKISEAYDDGILPLDVYVAAVGMQRANVRPEAADEFVAAIEESIANVPSRTVAAVESYWRESYWRGKSKPTVGIDALFESLYLECECQDDDDEEDEDEGEDDEEGDGGDDDGR